MDKKPINCIVVGCGNMGKNHVRLLSKSNRYSLKAVVDSANDLELSKDLVKAKSISELLRKGVDFDVAFVAVPTPFHFETGMELAKMKKHLLMEKPLCATIDECQKLIDEVKKQNIKLAVGHVERYNPAVVKLAEVLKCGWIGKPIHVSAVRVGGYPKELKPGDNVLVDLAVHDIDVARSLFGPLEVVSGIYHNTVKKKVADTAQLLLRAKAGMSVSIHVNWITPTKIRKLQITGTKGVCFVDYILQTCELFGGNLMETVPFQRNDFESIVSQYQSTDKITFGVTKNEPLKIEHEKFADYIEQGQSSRLCLGEDGLNAVLLARNAISYQAKVNSQFI